MKKEELYDLIVKSPIEVISVKPLYIDSQPTMYGISTTGVIFNRRSGRCLHAAINNNGYLMTSLEHAGVNKPYAVHRLVALTFIPNPENKPVVNHIDGDKTNPYVTNLEWVTYKENTEHAIRTGLMNPWDPLTKARGVNSGKNIHPEERIHRVCKLLQDGLGPTEISRIITEIDIKSIDSIRRGNNWKHISCQYKIPPAKHKIPLQSEIKNKIVDLARDGMSSNDIMKTLSLGDYKTNPYVYEQIQWIRRKLKTDVLV